MKIFIKLINILYKKNFFFHLPRETDLLIFGNTLKSFNFKKKTFILHNQIFVPILIWSLFKIICKGHFNLKKLNDLYFYETIKIMSPKVALGNEINFNIFKFKKFFPDKVAIAYQCVQWGEFQKRRLSEWLKIRPLICDYFFVFDKESKKILNFVKSKFIISGSVRNNEIITKKQKKKKYDVMFISEFRDKKGLVKKTSSKLIKLLGRESLTFQSFILKALSDLVQENKLKVCVSLASNRPEKKDSISYSNEKNFLHKNISKFHTEPITSYKLAEKSKIAIHFHSTLGKELLARNHKVMFVLYSKFKSINKKYLPSKLGKYWYKGKDLKFLKKKIIHLIKLNEKQWLSYLKKNNIGYEFDPKNKKLKKLINSFL